LTIINEILDYSKMEAGKTVLDSVVFHLSNVVSDVLRSLAFLAHQKGLELAWRIAPDVPADLTGDPARLGQVLINLVGNAIKFTDYGEVCVEVSLEELTNGRACLQFSIRDTGIGIALDQQDGLPGVPASANFRRAAIRRYRTGTGRLQEPCDSDGRDDRPQEYARAGYNHNLPCLL
jgi:signal transduction histidine kinase